LELKGTDIAEGWRGFRGRLVRKGFSQQFIDTYGEDLFAEAQLEAVKLIDRGEEVQKPPAFLIHCAWRRTQNLLDSQRRRPQSVPLEAVPDPRSELSTPDEDLLAADLRRRTRKAMSYLPLPERQIIELMYLREMSCREAGRALGWSSSHADRKHQAALERLRPFFEQTPP
jgi:RNA polymerase sigma factor (sigma-70 family)